MSNERMKPVLPFRYEKALTNVKEIGMEKFAEIFCEELQTEKYIFTPDEFFWLQNKDVKDKFESFFWKELKEFYIGVYQKMIPICDREEFILTLHKLEDNVPTDQILSKVEEMANKK